MKRFRPSPNYRCEYRDSSGRKKTTNLHLTANSINEARGAAEKHFRQQFLEGGEKIQELLSITTYSSSSPGKEGIGNPKKYA